MMNDLCDKSHKIITQARGHHFNIKSNAELILLFIYYLSYIIVTLDTLTHISVVNHA